VWIAEIQARIWNYSGPFGYNDMDMLGKKPDSFCCFEETDNF
jgi:hypothetical protein